MFEAHEAEPTAIVGMGEFLSGAIIVLHSSLTASNQVAVGLEGFVMHRVYGSF